MKWKINHKDKEIYFSDDTPIDIMVQVLNHHLPEEHDYKIFIYEDTGNKIDAGDSG